MRLRQRNNERKDSSAISKTENTREVADSKFKKPVTKAPPRESIDKENARRLTHADNQPDIILDDSATQRTGKDGNQYKVDGKN